MWVNLFTTRYNSPFFALNKECIYFLSRSLCFSIWLRLKAMWLWMQINNSQHGPPNYKFFILTGNLHEIPLHLCSEAWNSAMYPGEKHKPMWLFSGIATQSKWNLAFRKISILTGHLSFLLSKIQLPLWCQQENLRHSEALWRSTLPTTFEESL